MQPPFDDEQIDHPAHPARRADGLAQGSLIDFGIRATEPRKMWVTSNG
jgi:hypothetical protein